MVNVKIQYICDKCKKVKKERIITIKGYEDIGYTIENMDAAYMPDGWTVTYKKNKTILMCKTCSKKDFEKDGGWETVVIA